MTYQCKQVDIGDKCVECLRSTSFGSGLFVNRIPADNDEYIGWLCPECNFYECDRCNEKIYCDDIEGFKKVKMDLEEIEE